jgi:hypothetical protein
LQCVLDALEFCPALVKNSIWDVIAWNRAATAVLADYGAMPRERRNGLRLIFTDSRVRASPDWEASARFMVAVFRADTARAGASKRAQNLVADLCRLSPEFEQMWHDNDVRLNQATTRHLNHPTAGPIALDYSAFAVDGQPDLTLMILTPATPTDADRIGSLIRE